MARGTILRRKNKNGEIMFSIKHRMVHGTEGEEGDRSDS